MKFHSDHIISRMQEGQKGEDVLNRDLRRFLFESGIDYPFSQPRLPGSQVDIVANLETEDPLVLENKIVYPTSVLTHEAIQTPLTRPSSLFITYF